MALSKIPFCWDWTHYEEKCFFCGDKKGQFKRPYKDLRLTKNPYILDACYETVLQEINELNEENALPGEIANHLNGILNFLDTESGRVSFVPLMKTHKIMWHDKCRRSIRDPKYARLKRKTNEDDKSGSAVVSPVKTRRTTLDTSFNRTEDPSSFLLFLN